MPASLVPLYSNTDDGDGDGTILEQAHGVAGEGLGDLQGEDAWVRWGSKRTALNRALYTDGGVHKRCLYIVCLKDGK